MIELNNKRIYLAPYNDIAINFYKKLTRDTDIKFLGYIDNYKIGKNIFSPKDINNEYDFIIINSPIYWYEIYKSLTNNSNILNYDNGKLIPITNFYCKQKLTKNKLSSIKKKINLFLGKGKNIYKEFIISKSVKEMKKLQNLHKKERAFIIGNGPSLKVDQLDKLTNEITFACNKIFLAYNETKWRPTYYIVEDRLDIDEYLNTITKLKGSKKLIPDKFLETNKISSKLIYYPYKHCGNHCTEFSCDLESKFNTGFTVVFTMLELAVFMGIKELYIIGVDFNYVIPNNSNDKILKTENEVNHFHKDYRSPGDKWFSPNINLQYEAFLIAKDYAKKNGINIYNATEGGKLEVFPRVEFKELF